MSGDECKGCGGPSANLREVTVCDVCRERLASFDLTPADWLRANGVDTAPFTGTDHRCVRAIAALWDVFAYTRAIKVLVAVKQTLAVMQPSTRALTKKLIARAMDWSDVDELWPRVDPDNGWMPRFVDVDHETADPVEVEAAKRAMELAPVEGVGVEERGRRT